MINLFGNKQKKQEELRSSMDNLLKKLHPSISDNLDVESFMEAVKDPDFSSTILLFSILSNTHHILDRLDEIDSSKTVTKSAL